MKSPIIFRSNNTLFDPADKKIVMNSKGECATRFKPEPKELVDEELKKDIEDIIYNKALRYDDGKLRYDLVDPWAHEQLVKVFTFGANKYEPHNWRKGMKWSKMIASLKRHLAAIENGEDYDKESGLLHSAHLMWNAHALTAYYKTFPQGDDRQHAYLNMPKIGLDIDEVICDWINAWCKFRNIEVPHSWYFDYDIRDIFKDMEKNERLDSFYLSLEPRVKPEDILFDPHCYVTSRPVSSEITMAWLEKHGFPLVPVHTVGVGQSKLEVIKKSGCDIFVDDNFNTFVELNKAGICCYLFDTKHNRKFEVGHKRIKSLKELI